MANEFRSQSQMGGRVDYVKAGKPSFDLAKEAKKERAKMGGNVPPVQPAPSAKVPGKQLKTKDSQLNKSAAPHGTKSIKASYAADADEEY